MSDAPWGVALALAPHGVLGLGALALCLAAACLAAGRRLGFRQGRGYGAALAPLELRERALRTGRCPSCGQELGTPGRMVDDAAMRAPQGRERATGRRKAGAGMEGPSLRIVDLTLPFGPDVTPAPGHPRIQFEPIHWHERDGLSNTLCTFSVHTSTHIDAMFHFFKDGLTMERVPLERLVGPALLCDLRGVARPKTPLTVAQLEAAGASADAVRGKRLVLYGGWTEQRWNQEDFYTANPYLAEETARFLVESDVRALALDFSVDGGKPYPCHQILLGAEIPLIENLIHLDQLPRQFTLCPLPVPVAGGNGGPARVIALLD